MKNYDIKNISLATLHYFESCFAKNESPRDMEIVRWQFLRNPVEKEFVDIAIDKEKDKTAAIYAISPVEFKLEDEVLIGAQSLNTMTDKDYRGQGLFIKLAKSVYEKAENSGVKLVYGFPNGNSIYGFQKKLDWQILDPVPFLIKPLKSKYFTKRISFLKFLPNIPLSIKRASHSKNYKLETRNEFPLEVNSLWADFSKNIVVAINRNKTYLDWRYIEKPNEDYKIIHCYSLENKYLGFVVYAVKTKHKGKIGYIMELVYDLDDHKAGEILLDSAVSEIKTQNADCILSWCLSHSPNYKVFKKHFFLNMPEKIRPVELHFGARSFDAKYDKIINNRNSWYLSYSDSDTV